MKEKAVRKICLYLGIMMVWGLFAGCTKKSTSPAQSSGAGEATTTLATNAATAAKEPVQFKVLQWEWDFTDGDRIVKTIKDKFNVSFNVTSAAWGEWQEKLRIMISSGDIPDIFPTYGPGDQDYEKLIKEDLLMDLTDTIAKFPNLQKRIDSDATKFYKTNGRLYGYPRMMNDIPAHALYIRQDWLEKLNLQTPKTLDDLYNVLKEFVKNDPDGQKNVGLSLDGNWWMNFIIADYTGINEWGVKDGKHVNVAVDPGYKEALKYLHKLYEEKLLDPDYMLGKDKNSFDKFMSGRAGAVYQGFQSHEYGPVVEGLANNFPAAKVSLVIPPLQGPAGSFGSQNATPYFGMTHLRKDVKNPERLLEVMNYLATDEGLNLVRYGIEGVHYTKQGDKIVRNEKEYEKDHFNTGSVKTHNIYYLIGFDSTYWFPEHLKYNTMIGENIEKLRPYGLPSKVYGFSSENNTKLAPAIKDVYDKYQAQFITGELDIDKYWDEYVKKYREAGYDIIEKEVNEYMAHYK